MKKKLKVILLILTIFILAGCSSQKTKVSVPNGDSNFSKRSHYGNYISNEKELRHFIENKMMTKKGIYTNYKKQSYKKSVARGHELLSESSGMWLEYLAYTHQYKKFREFYQATKKTFDQKSQFSYRYTPTTNKKFDVNATLDDLRIIRALQMYADQTGNRTFKKEAARRFISLQKNTMSNGKIASFYDIKTKKASDDGSLAYYDFSTLKYFESTSEQNKKMYKKQLAVVQNGYLGDAFPLYASSYNWNSKTYSNNDLNTSEALETLLHLSEIGKLKQVSLNWLRDQVNRNTLYNSYSVNGNVVSRSHSAGSYALAAMIFAKQGNKAMYQNAMKLTWKYQVKNKKSAIYGGIGIEHQNEAYSYNNLTTLLAAKY